MVRYLYSTTAISSEVNFTIPMASNEVKDAEIIKDKLEWMKRGRAKET